MGDSEAVMPDSPDDLLVRALLDALPEDGFAVANAKLCYALAANASVRLSPVIS